jgi:hypothetical protein
MTEPTTIDVTSTTEEVVSQPVETQESIRLFHSEGEVYLEGIFGTLKLATVTAGSIGMGLLYYGYMEEKGLTEEDVKQATADGDTSLLADMFNWGIETYNANTKLLTLSPQP